MTYKEAFRETLLNHQKGWKKSSPIERFWIHYIAGPIAWLVGSIAGRIEGIKAMRKS